MYCIVTIIHKKDPSALRTHFVEAIFTFNNARCHPKYNCFAQTETERAKFDLSGDDKSKQRSYIYRMMLEPLTDLDKLQLTHVRREGGREGRKRCCG